MWICVEDGRLAPLGSNIRNEALKLLINPTSTSASSSSSLSSSLSSSSQLQPNDSLLIDEQQQQHAAASPLFVSSINHFHPKIIPLSMKKLSSLTRQDQLQDYTIESSARSSNTVNPNNSKGFGSHEETTPSKQTIQSEMILVKSENGINGVGGVGGIITGINQPQISIIRGNPIKTQLSFDDIISSNGSVSSSSSSSSSYNISPSTVFLSDLISSSQSFQGQANVDIDGSNSSRSQIQSNGVGVKIWNNNKIISNSSSNNGALNRHLPKQNL